VVDIGRAGFGAMTVTGGVGIQISDDGGVLWRVDGNRLETVMETGDGRLMLYEVEIYQICHDGVMQP
jgi:hypothetical protein